MRWLVSSVVANLGILGAFKYFGFFVQSLNVLLGQIGAARAKGLVDIVLPVGIWFPASQSLSYAGRHLSREVDGGG